MSPLEEDPNIIATHTRQQHREAHAAVHAAVNEFEGTVTGGPFASEADFVAHSNNSGIHGGNHPDLATHDGMGLATQSELDAHAATPHGSTHPDLAAHDTLGLATQSELDAHAATAGHTHPNLAAHDSLGLATQSELDNEITNRTSGDNARISKSIITAKGGIIVGAASGDPQEEAPGPNNFFLMLDNTRPKGVQWRNATAHLFVRDDFPTGRPVGDVTTQIRDTLVRAEAVAATTGKACVVEFHPDDIIVMDSWTSGVGGSVDYAWLVEWHTSGVSLEGNGCLIRSTAAVPAGSSSQMVFWPNGMGKLGNPGNFNNNWYMVQTVVPLSGSYSKGAVDITVTNINNFPGGLAVGDIILIRTGNTLPTADPWWPDSEINEVNGISGNVIQLRYPLSKPYAQEYFISGTSGVTSTTVTPNAAPYGVAKVTSSTIREVAIRNFRFDTPNALFWAQPMNLIGAYLENLHGDFGVGGVAMQMVRRGLQRNLSGVKKNSQLNGNMFVGSAVCSNDILVENIRVYGRHPAMVHFHEGTTDVTTRDISILTASTTGLAFDGGLSIRARAHGHKHYAHRFVGGTEQAALTIDSSCVSGGLIQSSYFDSPNASVDALIEGKNWQYLDNEVRRGYTIVAGNQISRAKVFGQEPLDGFVSRYTVGTTVPNLGSSATPTVQYPTYLVGAGTDITNLLGARDSEEVTLIFIDVRTIKEVNTTGRFLLHGGVDFVSTLWSTLTVRRVDSANNNLWVEVGRSKR